MARHILAAIDGGHGRNAPSLIWLNSFEGIVFFFCMMFMSFAATSFVIFVCGLSSGDTPKKKDSDSDDEPHGGEPRAEETLDAIEATTNTVWMPQVDPQQQERDHHRGGGGASGSRGGGGDSRGGGGCSGFNCGGGCGGMTCGAWGGHCGAECVGRDRHWGH